MCIHMKDCDQVLGHFGNTIQGQAGWKFQRDHLLYTLNAEGLGTDQCLSEVFTFQGAANSAWSHGGRATLWKSPRLLVLSRSEKSFSEGPVFLSKAAMSGEMSCYGLTSPFLYTVWQMEEAESRGAIHNMGSLMQAHRSTPASPRLLQQTLLKAKPSCHLSLFLLLLWGSEPYFSLLHHMPAPRDHSGRTRKSCIPRNPLVCCPFTGPVITQVTDCIHLGNIDSGKGCA
ncbi:hypothetical protein DV515_00002427 [Chloebia gouldiae]|uniref:Uncharacterized protein n=1 Tax=Chloebia gouldiae TaxID=44316 RepID=A0A3L8SWK3_CHLGU|nr:hypothetical protein DV515_00002427 [Chloebia gouldiae]